VLSVLALGPAYYYYYYYFLEGAQRARGGAVHGAATARGGSSSRVGRGPERPAVLFDGASALFDGSQV
jgi:hypothetical protein